MELPSNSPRNDLPSLPPGDSQPPPSTEPAEGWDEADTVLLERTLPPEVGLNVAADAPPEALPTIGHIGRYALKYRIGEGGLGTVYAAHDPLLSRPIAIKTVNVQLSSTEAREQFNALFLNEARAAGGLSHPHIVTVFDAGISEQGAYIAMELLKGKDLRELLKEGWRPTPAQAALIVRRAADALAYAHSKGVVHRDIKPANIFMVGRTQPRLLDFGIARITHQRDAVDLVAGSPYYMAPEQMREEPTDRRTDVFSLGVVLYELLTGLRPFSGNSLVEISNAVQNREPPRAHAVDARVPQGLSEIAARAMEKEPEHRYRSARALARDLRSWLDEHPESLQANENEAPQRRKRLLFGAAAAAGLALIGFGLWRGGEEHAAERATAPAASAATTVAVATTPPAAAPALAAPALAASASRVEPTPGPTPSMTESSVTPDKTASPGQPANAQRQERAAKAQREARTRVAKATAAGTAATGVLRIAVSPWGNVEVDGTPAGTTPPLNRLTLPEGRHTITVHNDGFPSYTATVTVSAGQPATLRHKFGS